MYPVLRKTDLNFFLCFVLIRVSEASKQAYNTFFNDLKAYKNKIEWSSNVNLFILSYNLFHLISNLVL